VSVHAPSRTLLSQARSFLFVPADRPERVIKALASSADAVVVDLEDAVAAAEKGVARHALLHVWRDLSVGVRGRVVLRINADPAAEFESDLALLQQLAAQGLGGAMVPKVDGAQTLLRIGELCPDLPLMPLVESAAAFACLDVIAGAPQVVRLCLGHLDLQADMGMQGELSGPELGPARWAVMLATRGARLAPPVDGVTTEVSDVDRVESDVRSALRWGFGAKLCVHPVQVSAVHKALRPAPQELDWAQRVLQAAESAGAGAVKVDGRMVDAPVLQLAQQLIARESANP
jgi:citrate lyase subunit beta/citryl-CoA lyase